MRLYLRHFSGGFSSIMVPPITNRKPPPLTVGRRSAPRFHIRLGRPEDVHAAAALHCELARELPGPDLSIADVASGLRASLTKTCPVWWFVGLCRDSLIVTAEYRELYESYHRGATTFAWFDNVALRPDFRGHGFKARMVSHLQDFARSRGMKHVLIFRDRTR